jgi:hypothetical protein
VVGDIDGNALPNSRVVEMYGTSTQDAIYLFTPQPQIPNGLRHEQQKGALCGLHTMNALNLCFSGGSLSVLRRKADVASLVDKGKLLFEQIAGYSKASGLTPLVHIEGAFDKGSGKPQVVMQNNRKAIWDPATIANENAIGLCMTFEKDGNDSLMHSVMLAKDTDGVFKIFDSLYEDPIPLKAGNMAEALTQALKKFGQGRQLADHGNQTGSFEILVREKWGSAPTSSQGVSTKSADLDDEDEFNTLMPPPVPPSKPPVPTSTSSPATRIERAKFASLPREDRNEIVDLVVNTKGKGIPERLAAMAQLPYFRDMTQGEMIVSLKAINEQMTDDDATLLAHYKVLAWPAKTTQAMADLCDQLQQRNSD